MKYVPWNYQEAAESWILSHRKCGLFLSMGLGKTVITLTAIQKLLAESSVHKVLVVAPLRVAATVWAEEIQKWDHLQGLRAVKVLGSQRDRLTALATDADIYIINRENVQWLVNHQAQYKVWPFDMLVLDELSSFKSAKAERFRSLRRVLPAVRRVVGLTGTPAPNGLIDLWSQIYLLDQGERLGKTLGWFRDYWFVPGDRNGAVVYNWKPKAGADKEIYGRLADICMSMTAEDYLKLPDRIDVTYPVVLSDTVQKAYETMEQDLVLPLAGEAITAQNAAVLAGKLLQLANGALYTETGDYVRLHDAKLGALEDLVEAANGEPVLVYVAFRSDTDRILQRFPQARVLLKEQDVKDWNAGRIPMLLAHPAAAGHGLNLQSGGHIIIWFGLTWSLELYQQANARLHRQGQQHPVTVHHIITRNTIDEAVLKALTGKAARQDALIEAVKARVDIYAG
jgi:SNF2 family DNA or RNA helicase